MNNRKKLVIILLCGIALIVSAFALMIFMRTDFASIGTAVLLVAGIAMFVLAVRHLARSYIYKKE